MSDGGCGEANGIASAEEGRTGMRSTDQEKINIAREYFMRADQGRPDILELFHEDAEIYFPKFGLGSGRNSFLEMVKGFEGTLEYIQHDYDRLIFVPSADHLVVEGTSPRQNVRQVLGRRQNSRRTFLQRLQISRWPNIEPAHLS
jgi:hypothetical protein